MILATSPQSPVSLGSVNHARHVAMAQDPLAIDQLMAALRECEGVINDLQAVPVDSDDYQQDLEDAQDEHVMLSIALKAAMVLRTCGFVNDTQAACFRKALTR
jgi:hypothetical protein